MLPPYSRDVVTDKPIDYEQLPSAAKTFVKAEFPALSVSYVPGQIVSAVATRWPGVQFRKIEKHRYGYEVELTNRLELKFDKQFRLTEIDD